MFVKKRFQLFILVAHFIVLLFYHFAGYAGHFGYDDLHYARLASDLTHGIANFGDHYFYRFTIVFFTSFAYKVFGVGDFASSLSPMLITVLILWVVFLVLKDRSLITLSLGLSLTLFSSWFIFYSDKLMPDIYLVLSVVLSLYVIQKYRFSSGKSPFIYSLLLVLSLFFGFLSKETILFMLPVLMFFMGIDFVKGQNRRFWFYSILAGLFFLILYFLLIWIFTGDILKRFSAITANSYLNLCSYDKQPVKMVLERISYQFIHLLLFQGMMISLLMVFIYLIKNQFKMIIRIENPMSFWTISALILFLTSNFMSVSFTSYSPMCLDPRHFLFLVPVAAIPASIVLADLIEKRIHSAFILISFTLITVVSFFLPGKSFYLHYLPINLVFAGIFLFKSKRYNPVFFTILFIACLMILPVESLLYARKVNYSKQREIVFNQILNNSDSVVVVTDEVQKRLGNYFLKFNTNSAVTFNSFDDFNLDSIGAKKAIMLLNAHTQYLSGINMETLPIYARSSSSGAIKRFEDPDLKISIFELNPTQLRSQKGIQIFNSINTFENQFPHWDLNGNQVSDSIKYRGNKSGRVGEYSPLFSFPVDSLHLNSYSEMIIESEVYINFETETKANLVIDISGSNLWNGMPLNQFIKAYSNWWPVKYDLKFDIKDIKPGSNIKIYIWNMDKTPAYVDDFKIRIFGVNK